MPGLIIRARQQGNLLKVKVDQKLSNIYNHKQGGGTRSAITGFSQASRKRLLEKFAGLDEETIKQKGCAFLTLTYGQQWPEPAEAKKHLEAYVRRIGRRAECLDPAFIWKMEPQERGAPHFHVAIFGWKRSRDGWPLTKWDFARMWGEVIGTEYMDYTLFDVTGDPSDIRAPFTRIELVRSFRRLMYYVSKYMAKEFEQKESSDRLPDSSESGGRGSSIGKGSRATGSTSPASGSKTPADGLESPLNGSESPTIELELPADGLENPSNGLEKAADGSMNAFNGSERPLNGFDGSNEASVTSDEVDTISDETAASIEADGKASNEDSGELTDSLSGDHSDEGSGKDSNEGAGKGFDPLALRQEQSLDRSPGNPTASGGHTSQFPDSCTDQVPALAGSGDGVAVAGSCETGFINLAYLATDGTPIEFIGRSWGIMFRDNLPEGDSQEVMIECNANFDDFHRLVRWKWARISKDQRGFTVFHEKAAAWFGILERYMGYCEGVPF